MAEFHRALDEPVDTQTAVFILGIAESLLNRLTVEAFADDQLYARAQSISEALDAGLDAVDRSGRAGRLT